MRLFESVGLDIKKAGSIREPVRWGTLDYIILEIDQYDTSGNRITKKVKYYLSGDKLMRDENDGNVVTQTCDHIEDIRFTNRDDGLVKINYRFNISGNRKITDTREEGSRQFQSFVIANQR